MNENFGLFFLILIALPTITALLVLTTYLLPERTLHGREVISNRPGRSFIIGLVNTLFFGLLAIILSDGGGELGGLLAIIILLALFALAIIGLAGLLLLLRQRIYPPTKTTTLSPLQTTIRTALLLLLAMLTPVIGWFVLAPILLLLGLGAGVIVTIRRKQQVPPES